MKTTRSRLIVSFTLAVVLGGLLGLTIRGALFRHGDLQSVNAGSADSRTIVSSVLGKRSSQFARTEAAFSRLNPTHQLLWLASRAESAEADDMPDLVRLAKAIGEYNMERSIASRWADLDPVHMINHLDSEGFGRSSHLYRVLFEKWSINDPETALTATVEAIEAEVMRQSHSSSLANELMKNAPEVGVKALRALKLQGFSPNMKNVAEWASKNPRAAAEHLIKHMDADPIGLDVLAEVGKAWGKSDPKAALTYAASLAPERGHTLSQSVMRAWTKSDPEAAAELASLESDPTLRAQLGVGLVAGLSENDPATALLWADENLFAASRASAITEVIKSTAKEDVTKAGALVSSMAPSGARNQATKALVRTWSGRKPLKEPLLEWIGTLDDAEMREAAMDAFEWRLKLTHKDLGEFIAGEHGHLANASIIRDAAEIRTRQDPSSAINWAQALPEERSSKAMQAVLKVWQRIAPEQAGAWIAKQDG